MKDEALIRCVISPEGALAIDAGNKGHGRGMYVHSRLSCFRNACARGFARSAKRPIRIVAQDGTLSPLSVSAFVAAVRSSVERRIEGLLVSALRCRELAFGADSVSATIAQGKARLVIVATDARAAGDLSAVRAIVAQGLCVSWGTKEILGKIVSRAEREVGVVSVSSISISSAIRRAVETLDACRASEGPIQFEASQELSLQTSNRLEFVHE
jgi:predicted RNA-binding protein YlxR (DUF448 family)/ribosomal protein L7Ae-like RNA K-turn-binding protein